MIHASQTIIKTMATSTIMAMHLCLEVHTIKNMTMFTIIIMHLGLGVHAAMVIIGQ